MTVVLVKSLEGLVRTIITVLVRPYPLLIDAFVTIGAKANYFVLNPNQFRAPFIYLKPLNGHWLHLII